jgi:hypothetical protein
MTTDSDTIVLSTWTCSRTNADSMAEQLGKLLRRHKRLLACEHKLSMADGDGVDESLFQ